MSIENVDKLNMQKDKKVKEVKHLLNVMKKYSNYKQDFENIETSLSGLLNKFQTENIRISIVAEVSSGKSTFLNALIFKDQVLESKVGETTAKLFHIKYDKNFSMNRKIVKDINELKKEISKQNSENLKNIEKNKSIDLSKYSSIITIPDENLKKGIELYDTPGFGTVNEETMQILLKEAISKSDAVVLLLDISQGIKKNEKNFVKDFLDNIPQNKRFIVLNKYDSVVSEDDLILKPKEEIDEEINNVIKEVESNLIELKNDGEKLEIFYLSSQKALIGKKLNDNEKLNSSRFPIFEETFWKRVVDAKKEVFDDNKKNLEKQKNLLINNFENKLKAYNDDEISIESLINISKDIENKLQKIITFHNKIKKINSSISTNTIKEIKENDYKLKKDIKNSLEKNIKPYLDDISFFNKLAFWSIKEKYQEAVKKGLENAENDLNNNLQKFFENNLKFLQKQEQEVNSIIDEIVTIFRKIEKLDKNIKLKEIEKVDFGFEIKNGKIYITKNSNVPYDASSLLGDLGMSISSGVATFSILEFGIARLLPMVMGPIGWAISAIFAIFTLNKATNKNDEILQKIVESSAPIIEKELSHKTEIIKDFVKMSSATLTNQLVIIDERIESIKNSISNKDDLQKELKNIESKINEVNSFLKEISK
jgi:hypothetical protein